MQVSHVFLPPLYLLSTPSAQRLAACMMPAVLGAGALNELCRRLRKCLLPPSAELWKKFHTYAILQRAEANLWTKEHYEDWEPCDEVK